MTTPFFKQIKQQYECNISTLKALYLEREITLKCKYPKKAFGRKGKIKSIIIEDGTPKFLCMIYNLNEYPNFLNGDSWTRCYRTIADFDFS